MNHVLAVCGLAREARIAAGEGIDTIQAAADPSRLRAALASRPKGTARAVISFGIAGGLDPDLAPGDVVVGLAALADRRYPAASILVERLEDRLLAAGLHVVLDDCLGVDMPVMTAEAKAGLRATTRAAVVDMESHVAAAYAARNGLPFAILRVVCDPATRALPAFAAQAVRPDGEPDVRAVMAALLRGRASPGALLRLARDSGAAFRSLGRARAALGLALGVGA